MSFSSARSISGWTIFRVCDCKRQLYLTKSAWIFGLPFQLIFQLAPKLELCPLWLSLQIIITSRAVQTPKPPPGLHARHKDLTTASSPNASRIFAKELNCKKNIL